MATYILLTLALILLTLLRFVGMLFNSVFPLPFHLHIHSKTSYLDTQITLFRFSSVVFYSLQENVIGCYVVLVAIGCLKLYFLCI